MPRICADGAANLLHEQDPQLVPTHIVGDLDSVTRQVRAHYERLGAAIVRKPSQDSNDFHKSLVVATAAAAAQSNNNNNNSDDLPLVVLGGMYGRMDQTLGNINQLYCHANSDTTRAIYWMSARNLLTVLSAGKHAIHTELGLKCGLIPVGGAVSSVTTEGLKWDMSEECLEYGGLVSSSNEAVSPVITVDTSHRVCLTVEIGTQVLKGAD